jgi:hypothetical protein
VEPQQCGVVMLPHVLAEFSWEVASECPISVMSTSVTGRKQALRGWRYLLGNVSPLLRSAFHPHLQLVGSARSWWSALL